MVIFSGVGYWFTQLGFAYGTLAFYVASMFAGVVIQVWAGVGIFRSAGRHIVQSGNRLAARAAQGMVLLGAVLSIAGAFTINRQMLIDAYQQAIWIEVHGIWKVETVVSGDEIELTGGISRGLASAVESKLGSNFRITRLRLNLKNGGLVSEANKLASIVRARNLDVITTKECSSSCTIVFLAGKHRAITDQARLGFHAYKMPGMSGGGCRALPEKRVDCRWPPQGFR